MVAYYLYLHFKSFVLDWIPRSKIHSPNNINIFKIPSSMVDLSLDFILLGVD